MRGSLEPRVWTRPLVELTRETSYGFDVIDFARDVLGQPLDPWECWAAIHLGELLPDGRPRFRTVLILVARQNGKTFLGMVLILYWLYVDEAKLVLGTSTDRSYAKRAWQAVIAIARGVPDLLADFAPGTPRLSISEESFELRSGAEYVFRANNGSAGRSMTVHRWLCDELRQHKTSETWASATNAMNAVIDGQVVVLTNQGDDTAVQLDALHAAARAFIETGQGDYRLGLLEWSAPEGADPTDVYALAQANPNLGYRVDTDALLGAAVRAVAAGGTELSDFRTEVMCQRVNLMDPAIEPAAWERAGGELLDLAAHRDRVALCLDVALDNSHATLMAAATIEGVTYVDVVQEWTGGNVIGALRRELAPIVARVKPRALGWFPNGPAAALSADMAADRTAKWPPRGVVLDTLHTEATAVCMALPPLVADGSVRHGQDPMVDAQIEGATRLKRGDGFVFARRGARSVDAVYALAGAVHLARTLPPPRPALAIVSAGGR